MSSSAENTRTRLARREIPRLPQPGRGLHNVPAWLVSLLFHLTILTLVGTFWVTPPRGTHSEPDRPVGVAVVYETSNGEEFFLSDVGDTSSGQSTVANQALNALPTTSSTLARDEILDELLPGAASAAGELASAAGALGLGEGGAPLGNSRGTPKTRTSVFGIEGEGTRFLYVFDRSDSMNGYGGLPLRTAKAELLKSLESLGPSYQFQIIFYNDTPLPYGGMNRGGPQLLRGDDRSKRDAQRFVNSVSAIGGTRHVEAIRMALAMGPDVVFFLTDADQPAPSIRDIEDLQTIAARLGASIHAIQFGAGPNQGGGGWIKRLASGTAGVYRYIDVTQL